ncbi:MAG: hypothetical protein CVV10_06170 [Gammaproteobacteria bacterium HGW-Gammaproteobacteria-14]|nr:MAG: hypothetical protein CVV10_06170 [Gammaproteobacteria bacterium HGW-Gammaproteobacteria-14]
MPAAEQSLFQSLIRRPAIAWPTVVLFAAAGLIYISATLAAIQGLIPSGVAIALNAIAAFWFFTVFHEASHNALSEHKALNDWLGRISILPFSPAPIFRAFRFIHMQHHRFANQGRDKDPDGWCGGGNAWTLPLRWATLDLNYYVFYLPKLKDRPRDERNETLLAIAFGVLLVALVVMSGYAMEALLYWFIPGRIAIVMLALAFDFLPHHPHQVSEQEDPYRATSNRVGMEWLLTPVLLYQNYHLVHHLYPRAPFYRYLKIWKAKEAEHLAHNPYLIDLIGRQKKPPDQAAF